MQLGLKKYILYKSKRSDLAIVTCALLKCTRMCMLTWLQPCAVVAIIQNAAFILAHSGEDAAGVGRRIRSSARVVPKEESFDCVPLLNIDRSRAPVIR